MNNIKGGLLALAMGGEFDSIIHGRNCYCTMGAGLARGDWNIDSEIIGEELKDETHSFVDYQK